MFGISKPLIQGAGVLLGVLLATAVEAQGIRPAAASRRSDRAGVNQMEIFNGSMRTVRYFGENLSPSESATLRELERLENESEYVRDLNTLKEQYVVSERFLETYRRIVQLNEYGVDTTRSASGALYSGYGNGGYGGYGAYAGYYGYPSAYSGGAMASDSVTQTRSLATGVGNEGKLKDAMALVLAQQATPEYAANLDRAYDRVAMRASASPTLRVALRLPSAEDARKERDTFRMASGETAAPSGVTLTLKSGDVIRGTRMQEDKDWYLVDVAGGKTRIRQSEVIRIDVAASKSGIAPALYEK